MRLEDLPEVKPHLITKLKGAGIESIFDLAISIPHQLIEDGGVLTGADAQIALELVMKAKKALIDSGLLAKDFSTAEEILERRKNLLRCTTGSSNLNSFLKGGIETQAMTEIAGEFGSGKSQLCYTLCVTANMPTDKEGLGGNVIFIDTENTFRPERIHQIAENRGINEPENVLRKIYVCKIFNSGHLELIIQKVSSKLYDGSGSIKMILTKDIASKVMQKNLSELILLASQPISNNTSQFQTSICKIKIPDGIEVIEAVSENVSSYRKSGRLIVTDGRNLVFFPIKEEHTFTDFTTRRLQASEIEDRKIIRRLIEKALEISLKRVTGKNMMHGIFLLEDPIPLYRCEKAKLYVGFSVRANLTEKADGRVEEAVIELSPQAYVRESVLDYVNLRRERGASANAIVRNLTTYRNRVIVAPPGNYGSITEVIMRKGGNQKVSESDTRNLVEFWKQIYGIDISPEEIPLLKIKMVNSENTFTYPPSMCFFAGGDSLVIPAAVQGFIESKKSTLKARMDEVASKAIHDLKIGDLSLGSEATVSEQKTDIQTQLLQETRQKLFGRNVSARGSIISVHGEIWFFPSQIQFS
jgi:Rad51